MYVATAYSHINALFITIFSDVAAVSAIIHIVVYIHTYT
jgi:hypothetical protein